MPVTTTCPNCQRTLNVPDELVGQSVRCPSCAVVWTASSAADAEGFRATPDSLVPVNEGIPGEHTSNLATPPKPPLPPEYDEDEDDEDDELVEQQIEQRFARRRAANLIQDARSKLRGPAIGMFIVSIVSVFNVVYVLFSVGMTAFMFSAAPAGGAPPGMAIAVVINGLQLILGIATAILTLLGGIQMLKLRHWGLCFTACIAAMVPNCQCCFLIGIPFGIWGIVMLVHPDVKRAFQEN